MISKRIATSCVMAALAMTPASRVMADGGDVALGLIVGGIVGGAIANEQNKKKQVVVRRAPVSSTSSAQREENRQVQTALNYFGYPAGTPDGVIGAGSRAAISQYQVTLGYPPTGQMTEYEKMFLLTSYQRGIAGGMATQQMAMQNPMGMKGLLVAWRDESMGINQNPGQLPPGQMAMAPNPYGMAVAPQPYAAPMPSAPVAAAVPAPLPVEPPAPVVTAAAPVAVPAPLPVAPEPAAPATGNALPSFLGGDVMQASLASYCNKVSLSTSSNGGFVTAASLNDPDQALGEQFCLARTYAISQGEEMASKIPGFTPQQIAQQCEGFGPAMQAQIAALSTQPAPAVVSAAQGFAASTGMAPQQLAATAKICLSVGYRTDNMDVAIGSALLLAATGAPVYSELLGHHLAEGFGVAERPDLALGWYDMGLAALEAGIPPVFAPGQPERAALIKRAAYKLGGRPDPMPAPVPAALPSFSVPSVPAAPAAPAATPAAPGTPEQQSSLGAPTVTPQTLAVVAPAAPAELVPAAAPAGQTTTATVGAVSLATRLPGLLFGN